MSRIDLTPAQTTPIGVRLSVVRSADSSHVSRASRCTPPSPPVANTRIPARLASSAVAATVVAPSLPRAAAGPRSRTLSLGISAPVAIRSTSSGVKPTVGWPRITPTVAGTPPSESTIASSSRASARFSGCGTPCAISVLSRATTGRPQASASATSGRSRIGVPAVGILLSGPSLQRGSGPARAPSIRSPPRPAPRPCTD